MKNIFNEDIIDSSTLSNKVERAIRLIKTAYETRPSNEEKIEIAYSGGKDSDVILRLAQMAGVPFEAVYKNTTIDPPGTIKHVRENGVTIVNPKRSFFDIIQAKGFPSMFHRYCCEELKEYKTEYYNQVVGIRADESVHRKARYKEPVICRTYRKQKSKVQQFLPILYWTLADVEKFIKAENIKLAPIYYKADGDIDFEKRLGCMGCPLACQRKRLQEFKEHPNLLRAYIRAGEIFLKKKPNTRIAQKLNGDKYALFLNNLYLSPIDLGGLFPTSAKQILEDFFSTTL